MGVDWLDLVRKLCGWQSGEKINLEARSHKEVLESDKPKKKNAQEELCARECELNHENDQIS